jgi:hypothetical protein
MLHPDHYHSATYAGIPACAAQLAARVPGMSDPYPHGTQKNPSKLCLLGEFGRWEDHAAAIQYIWYVER